MTGLRPMRDRDDYRGPPVASPTCMRADVEPGVAVCTRKLAEVVKRRDDEAMFSVCATCARDLVRRKIVTRMYPTLSRKSP